MLRRGLLALALALPFAAAQADDKAALQKELDLTFQKLLVDPSDRMLNRRMIDLALALDDHDAAIGAVERLIFYEPNNAELQLEVAKLYLEIGAVSAARGYLDDLLALSTVPDGVRNEATALAAKIDRETQGKIWAAFAQVGARYQTNANIGSRELGLDDNFPFEDPIEDWNSFALGTLAYANPIGNVVLEGSISGYYADQEEVNRLDLGFAEITAGPRFVSENELFSIKPYGLVQGILLGSDPYQFTYGGGVVLRLAIAEGMTLEPQFEYRNRTFYNSDDYPDATNQTGELFTYAIRGSADVSEDFNWTWRLAFNRNDAAEDYHSYDQYLASLGFDLSFDVFGWENWKIAPFAAVSFAEYKEVLDPIFYPEIREDLQWSVGASLEIPLAEQTAFGIQIQYTDNKSNLDRFTYQNLQVIMGPTGRF